MKQCLVALVLLVWIGCTTDDNPIGPSAPIEIPTEPPVVPTWYYADLTGYGEMVEPGYTKAYSDGSWEKYGGILTVRGNAYTTVLSSDSTRYYYTMTTGQYAGYKPKGEEPIIFDAPPPALPTRWRSDTTVVITTGFQYKGYSVSTKTVYSLVDTAGITTPLGTFLPVAHLFVRIEIRASSGHVSSASQETWLARGPGLIKFKRETLVYFVHGFVNGRPWGSASGAPETASQTATTSEAMLKALCR